jgi:hypothetical protein
LEKATVSISDNGKGDSEISEPFRRHVNVKHETWGFVVATLASGKRFPEKLERRHTHGNEIALLRGGKSTWGW